MPETPGFREFFAMHSPAPHESSRNAGAPTTLAKQLPRPCWNAAGIREISHENHAFRSRCRHGARGRRSEHGDGRADRWRNRVGTRNNRTIDSAVDDAIDDAVNDTVDDHDDDTLGDDAELESVHAGAWHDHERSADAGHIQPDGHAEHVHDEPDTAQSGNDAAIVDMSADIDERNQFYVRAGDPADGHTALTEGQMRKEYIMKLKTLALCGASIAFMSIGATAVIADPAAGDPYTQNPTPQERAQTQQLNNGAANDAVTSTSAVQAQDDANQAQYQQQQEQYQNDKDRYDAQQQRYQDRRAEYDYDRTHPFSWWHERYDEATLNHFYDVPRAELVDLRVMREDGFTVGRIREIDRHGDGRVEAVRVIFRDGESAWIKTRDLRYDPEDRIVFTDLSVAELHAMARNS